MDKELRENMEKNDDTVAGWCKCCGNQVLIRSFGLTTQDEFDNEATRQCSCDGAEEIRYREEQASLAHAKAEKMLDDVNPDVVAVVNRAIDLAAGRKIQQLSLKLGKGIAIKITVTAKGKIKITKETKETETEVA